MNLKDKIEFLFKTKVIDGIDNMVFSVFKCITDEKPKIDKEEIESGQFLPIWEVKELINKNIDNTTSWFRISFQKYWGKLPTKQT